MKKEKKVMTAEEYAAFIYEMTVIPHAFKLIADEGNYLFGGNQNTWDTNYHLYDKTTGVDHLIDISDLWEALEDEDEEPMFENIMDIIEYYGLPGLLDFSWTQVIRA